MSLKLCSVGAELRFVGGGLATALVTVGVPHNRVKTGTSGTAYLGVSGEVHVV